MTTPAPASASVTTPPAGGFALDAARSTITFGTRHMFGLGRVRGSFALRSGRIEVGDPVTRSRAHAEIDAASFRTGNRARDGMVRSATYLDTANHPIIRFESHRLVETGDRWALRGTLTVRQVPHEVELDIERCSVDSGELAVRATTRIDRTEFGITAQPGMTGRYLDLVLDIVAAPGHDPARVADTG